MASDGMTGMCAYRASSPARQLRGEITVVERGGQLGEDHPRCSPVVGHGNVTEAPGSDRVGDGAGGRLVGQGAAERLGRRRS
jgi:hypothetical protein